MSFQGEEFFTALDWVLFISVLLISVFVGVFYALREKFSKKVTSADEYLMGGRQLPLIPVALSLLVGPFKDQQVEKYL